MLHLNLQTNLVTVGFNVIVLYPDASPYLGSVYIAVLVSCSLKTKNSLSLTLRYNFSIHFTN